MININEYICRNLEELKRNNPEYYNQTYNILSFLYKDIEKEYLSKERERLFIEEWAPRIDSFSNYDGSVKSFTKLNEEIFKYFVNGENGIIETLFDMCKYKDQRYAKTFFESVEMPINMFRDRINSETTPIISYIFNLYTMLTGYRYNKNDYDSFAAIVEDSKYSFSEKKYKNNYRDNAFINKKTMIESILENNDFKNMHGLRFILKTLLLNFCNGLDSEVKDKYEEIINYYKKLNDARVQAEEENKVIDEETLKEIIADLNACCEGGKDIIVNQEIYFEKVLLFNNRYQFIKERLPKIDNNKLFKKQITSYIANMDVNFFDYINSLNIYYDDSFIEMMKIVFDSDSFKAVISRLSAIVRASRCYIEGNNEEMLQILKDLPTSQHNAFYESKEIKLSQESNNITKPASISERMILFYQINFGLGKNSECLRKYKYNQYYEISDFVNALDEEVRKIPQTGIEATITDDKPKRNLLSIFK